MFVAPFTECIVPALADMPAQPAAELDKNLFAALLGELSACPGEPQQVEEHSEQRTHQDQESTVFPGLLWVMPAPVLLSPPEQGIMPAATSGDIAVAPQIEAAGMVTATVAANATSTEPLSDPEIEANIRPAAQPAELLASVPEETALVPERQELHSPAQTKEAPLINRSAAAPTERDPRTAPPRIVVPAARIVTNTDKLEVSQPPPLDLATSEPEQAIPGPQNQSIPEPRRQAPAVVAFATPANTAPFDDAPIAETHRQTDTSDALQRASTPEFNFDQRLRESRTERASVHFVHSRTAAEPVSPHNPEPMRDVFDLEVKPDRIAEQPRPASGPRRLESEASESSQAPLAVDAAPVPKQPLQVSVAPGHAIETTRDRPPASVQETQRTVPVAAVPEPEPQPVDKTIPVQKMTVRIPTDDNQVVAVRFSHRGDSIDVGVRASHAGTADTLRRDLPDLMEGLKREGFRSEMMTSATGAIRDASTGGAALRLADEGSWSNDYRGRREPDEWFDQRGRKHKHENEAQKDD